MKVDKLQLQPQGKVPFQLSAYLKVPEDFGCYVLTSFEERILYIGQSKTCGGALSNI